MMTSKDIRVFKTRNKEGKDLVWKVVRPSQAVSSKGELIAKARYSEALRAGILMNAEVLKILRDRGLWGDEQEARAKELRDSISNLEEKLKDHSLSNDDGKTVVEEIKKLRGELQEHNGVLSTVVDHTCESLGQEERNQFFAAELVVDNTTGQRVYKSFEDFKNRLDDPSTIDSYRETVIALLGVAIGKELPSDLQDEYVENKWLSERGLLDKAPEEAEEQAPKPVRKRKQVAE